MKTKDVSKCKITGHTHNQLHCPIKIKASTPGTFTPTERACYDTYELAYAPYLVDSLRPSRLTRNYDLYPAGNMDCLLLDFIQCESPESARHLRGFLWNAFAEGKKQTEKEANNMTITIAEKQFIVKTTAVVTLHRIANILVGAFEGGSNYWITKIILADKPKTLSFGTDDKGNDYYPRTIRYPLSGGSIQIIEDCGEGFTPKTRLLNIASIQKGLEIMAEKYPKHFDDLINENDDAGTSDVFLQCALLGEIVYG